MFATRMERVVRRQAVAREQQCIFRVRNSAYQNHVHSLHRQQGFSEASREALDIQI
jgi:hypothetical protein